MNGDRVLLRGVAICLIAAAGIVYEILKMYPPRWELIAGYVVVTGLAVFRMITRSNRDQNQSSQSAESTHEKTS